MINFEPMAMGLWQIDYSFHVKTSYFGAIKLERNSKLNLNFAQYWVN